jgi:hypothetical protein
MPRKAAPKRRKASEPPLVIVEWADAEGDNRWMSANDLEDFAASDTNVVRTVGWLVKRTKTDLILTSTMALHDDDTNDVNRIPRGMVRKVINLYA